MTLQARRVAVSRFGFSDFCLKGTRRLAAIWFFRSDLVHNERAGVRRCA
jgi:hypothetical protein